MSHVARPASPFRSAAAVGAVGLLVLAAGCSRGSQQSDSSASNTASGKSECPDVVAKSKQAVAAASKKDAAWDGPTSGPKAESGKSIVYVAQSMQNPGIAGAAKGVQAAGKAIGWDIKIIDGQGTPDGTQNAFSQALTTKPDGIMIGGFDPKTAAAQVKQANTAKIPLVGWQALADPGPSKDPQVFSNVTTKVEDVAKISADYIIAKSNGTAGVVVFTDLSIPFAAGKSKTIQDQLKTCKSIDVLKYDNVPLSDVANRMPRETSSLLTQFADKWNYSVAINDVYFENAAPALRAAGKQGDEPPYNVGAGDGDPSALQRIRSGQFQTATVPSPLLSEGWQMVDEMNRAFAGKEASGYVPQVHVSTKENLGDSDSWDPAGYQAAYKKIWGK